MKQLATVIPVLNGALSFTTIQQTVQPEGAQQSIQVRLEAPSLSMDFFPPAPALLNRFAMFNVNQILDTIQNQIAHPYSSSLTYSQQYCAKASLWVDRNQQLVTRILQNYNLLAQDPRVDQDALYQANPAQPLHAFRQFMREHEQPLKDITWCMQQLILSQPGVNGTHLQSLVGSSQKSNANDAAKMMIPTSQ